MLQEKRLDYTEEGKQELSAALTEIIFTIEKVISDDKFVPGEETVIVTASDVRNALNNIEIIQRRRIEFRRTLVRLYLFIGIIVTLIGLFYPWLSKLEALDPIRLTFLATGATMTCVAVMLGHWIRVRYQKAEAETELRHRQTISRLAEALRETHRGAEPSTEAEADWNEVIRAMESVASDVRGQVLKATEEEEKGKS